MPCVRFVVIFCFCFSSFSVAGPAIRISESGNKTHLELNLKFWWGPGTLPEQNYENEKMFSQKLAQAAERCLTKAFNAESAQNGKSYEVHVNVRYVGEMTQAQEKAWVVVQWGRFAKSTGSGKPISFRSTDSPGLTVLVTKRANLSRSIMHHVMPLQSDGRHLWHGGRDIILSTKYMTQEFALSHEIMHQAGGLIDRYESDGPLHSNDHAMSGWQNNLMTDGQCRLTYQQIEHFLGHARGAWGEPWKSPIPPLVNPTQ